MSLSHLVVRRKVTLTMLTLGMLLIGALSFFRLPQELFPPINFPQITVVTEYANAAPEEIETLITRPIEESVSSVAGIKHVESVSREGRSAVTIAFDWSQDIDFAALAVREKIDLIKERLPKESGDPIVLKYDPLSRPILILSVTGDHLDPVHLKRMAEKIVKDPIEKIDGVASATLSGGAERRIFIDVDQGRLEAHHLALPDVADSVGKANVSYPAGSIQSGLYEYLIRTAGEFRSVPEIAGAVVQAGLTRGSGANDAATLEKTGRGPRATAESAREESEHRRWDRRLVLVRDIATVTDGAAERTSISRHNGSENISIAIQKQANANTIQVVDRVRLALKAIQDEAPKDVHVEIIYDHSTFIRQSLQDLASDALVGSLLAFVVLLLFLRTLGPAVCISLMMPITVVGTFFLMKIGGITLNTMSLGGLTLGAGMIVDTAIVVLENIFRRRQLGEDRVTAAVLGTREVTLPVITSNLTTIAVFIPLIVFVPGLPGQLFKDLSWAIVDSQIISTVVPLTLLPLLSLYLEVKPSGTRPPRWVRFLTARLSSAAPEAGKTRFAAAVVGGALLICSSAFLVLPRIEREVLPKVDQGQFSMRVEMPLGTRLEVTDRVCLRLEALLATSPDVAGVAVTIGSEKGSKSQVAVDALRPSQAVMLVTLLKERKHPTVDVVRLLREGLSRIDVENGRVEFILQEGEFAFAEGSGKPIRIEVKGYDLKAIGETAARLKTELAAIPGVFAVEDDFGQSAPETKLVVDKSKAAVYGITAMDISRTAKVAIDGAVATQYREAGKEFDVVVRLNDQDRSDPANLGHLLVYSRSVDALIPVREVASVERSESPSEIKRLDQDRTLIVSADIDKRVKSKDVFPLVQELIDRASPAGDSDVRVRLSGQAREIKESFIKMMFAFALAFLLVYMIMAAQFESYLQPLIIMITVPLALFGVTAALVVSGTSVNVISALGVIILVGTVVNNGIVLIEYINQMRAEGKSIEEAALEAASIRTRPILMSALTAVIGLVPLALGLGEGAELRSPMAVTMMGGLLSSTFLTLVVVPCFYVLIERLTERKRIRVSVSTREMKISSTDIKGVRIPPLRSRGG